MRNRWLILPCIAAILVWSVSLKNGFLWDDHILIEKNESTLSSISLSTAFGNDFWSTETESGHSNYYRPLITLSYMVDYALYLLDAAGYHTTNILVHTANVALVFLILTALSIEAPRAALATMIFSVHPALAESVAWVSGRTDLIATLWILLTILFFLCAHSGRITDRRWLTLSALAFALALFSKESAICAPLIALALAPRGSKKAPLPLLQLTPFAIVGMVWFIVRSTALDNPIGAEGATGISTPLGILSLLHVWGNLLWPPVFRVEYGSSLTALALLTGAISGTLVISLLGGIILGKRFSQATRLLALASLLAFIPSVLAVLLKSMIGVRLVYTSAAFALPALALALSELVTRRAMIVTTALISGILGYCSMERSALWLSDEVLFQHALAAQDASSRSHLNLGIALYNKGDLIGALDHLSHEIEAAAADQQHYMLALLYTASQCETRAEQEYRKSIAAKPSGYSATHNLAGLLTLQGKTGAARELLNNFGMSHPEYRSQALRQLAMLEKLPAQPERAPIDRPWCSERAALEDLYQSALPLNRIGGELLKSQQLDMAEVFIKASLRADPTLVAASLNLAQLQMLRGNYAAAQRILTTLSRERPEDPRAQQLLTKLQSIKQRPR